MPSDHTPGDAATVIASMSSTCLLMRTRLISRIVTGIHDDALKSHAISSPQFVLLMVIHTLQPATRADIARYHYQGRSTLTRNLRLTLTEGSPSRKAGPRKSATKPVAGAGRSG